MGVGLLLLGITTAVLGRGQVTLSLDPVTAVPETSAAGRVQVAFQANLHIKNEGERSVLLLTGEKPVVVGVYIGRSEHFRQAEALVSQYRGPAVDTSNRWKELAEKVLKAPIGQSGLSVIRPGESLDFAQEIAISLPESKRDPVAGGRSDMPLNQLVQEGGLWVSVAMEAWPRNLERVGGRKPLSKAVGRAREQEGTLLVEPLISIPARLTLHK